MEFLKPENIKYIVIHCTDTEPRMSIDVETIRQWHFARGFEDIGYHFLIMPDGIICKGRSLEYVGAHCQGLNRKSIGIAYVGGRLGCSNHDTRTRLQKLSICTLVCQLVKEYPTIEKLIGHHDFNNRRLCPCFDVLADYGVWFDDIKREIRSFRHP